MTTSLNLRDGNTGKFITIDADAPTGTLWVIDANTGHLDPLNLAGPISALGWVVDAETGALRDLATYTGLVTVVDANTGKSVVVDPTSPSGKMKVNDFNTGKLVEIDLATAYLIPFIDDVYE